MSLKVADTSIAYCGKSDNAIGNAEVHGDKQIKLMVLNQNQYGGNYAVE